ncbi:cytochrome C [Sulfurospirillum sp. 1612]|uniref:cytochrome C n=1 Tax=Sulfurospirillum sp. 1612 TaxID=3094835 RepID=UPI002F95A62B
MRQIISLAVAFVFFGLVMGTNLNASVIRGKKYYIKLLKTPCGFYGSEMGKKHTVYEWRNLYKTGQLAAELQRICPTSKRIQSKKQLKHLSQFLEYFASDSGNVPSCSQ